MNKLKDSLYYISDLILAFVVLFIIFVVFYQNISIFFTDIFSKNVFSTKTIREFMQENSDETVDISNSDKVDNAESQKTQENEIKTQISDGTKELQENELSQVQNNSQNGELAAQTSIDEKNTDNNKDIVITIPQNVISSDIVNILYENKLISSKEEMENYLRTNNLETKLKSGTFMLNPSMSIEEIAKAISL